MVPLPGTVRGLERVGLDRLLVRQHARIPEPGHDFYKLDEEMVQGKATDFRWEVVESR